MRFCKPIRRGALGQAGKKRGDESAAVRVRVPELPSESRSTSLKASASRKDASVAWRARTQAGSQDRKTSTLFVVERPSANFFILLLSGATPKPSSVFPCSKGRVCVNACDLLYECLAEIYWTGFFRATFLVWVEDPDEDLGT